MLKPDLQPRERTRSGRRWLLSVLVPPLVLGAWALIGMDVRVGRYQFETGWRRAGPSFIERLQGPVAARCEYLAPSGVDLYPFEAWVGEARIGDAMFNVGIFDPEPRF